MNINFFSIIFDSKIQIGYNSGNTTFAFTLTFNSHPDFIDVFSNFISLVGIKQK